MAEGMYRIGVVGASSLVGKELSDELQDSLLAASDFVLFDDDETAGGVITAAGDEAAFIQRVEDGSFSRMDFVFFAGVVESTRKHWEAARQAGAAVVDLTGALEGEPGVPVRAPLVTASTPDLGTAAVVAAHPAAVMLALVASRLAKTMPLRSMSATVVEPASQHGREAMDEVHQQTIGLLNFQSLPREQYDAQVAFNVLPGFGASAKVDLLKVEETIARHYALLGPGLAPLDLELVQAPVFHGYVGSVLVELESDATLAQVSRALDAEPMEVVSDEQELPSNLSAAGQQDVLLRVRGTASPTRYRIWMAADNLKLSALNAIACANELKRLRPRGKVQ